MLRLFTELIFAGGRRLSRRSGQTMLEFIMVFALIGGLGVMVLALLGVFNAYGGRVLDLMAWDYP